MGCIHSKRAASVAAASPPLYQPPLSLGAVELPSSTVSSKNPSGSSKFDQKHKRNNDNSNHNNNNNNNNNNSFIGNHKNRRKNSFCNVDGEALCEDQRNGNVRKLKKGGSSGSYKLGFPQRLVGVEQIAAGWPPWLSSAAGEAVAGWVPLRADAFEKLEKIGQGTYSSVFRAREVATGRMVALKKVRFDNFQPESIRFMAREILILRRLNHPNIMKLDGIITSRLSNSIYLVFEYMEHDLAGLSSSPDIKFSESQVKCYMKQLLCGIEHCHVRGIIHRDIKTSNILVNNEGVLKLGDFGLANILNSRNRQQLTSRVVTLWYRPPELLMGSTSYGVSVDLWSIGCVFAELLIGKPLLKGRTEVEQLHKIFKFCGSPSDEFWTHSKLPNATMFRPQNPYESSLRERLKDFPSTAVDLIETFLSLEPEKRGTASSALLSQYFNTAPYACEPSSLPKYAPNKEMDAKYRDEARRKKVNSRVRDSGVPRKPRRVHRTLHEEKSFNKFAVTEEEAKDTSQIVRKTNHTNPHLGNGRRRVNREPSISFDTISETSQGTKGDIEFTGPAPLAASSGFAWVKHRKDDVKTSLSYDPSLSSSQVSALDSSRFSFLNNSFDFSNGDQERYEKYAIPRPRKKLAPSDSFDAADVYHPYDSMVMVESGALGKNLDCIVNREKIEFSGPLLSQSDRIDQLNKINELLLRNENQIRRTVHKSRAREIAE